MVATSIKVAWNCNWIDSMQLFHKKKFIYIFSHLQFSNRFNSCYFFYSYLSLSQQYFPFVECCIIQWNASELADVGTDNNGMVAEWSLINRIILARAFVCQKFSQAEIFPQALNVDCARLALGEFVCRPVYHSVSLFAIKGLIFFPTTSGTLQHFSSFFYSHRLLLFSKENN